MARQGATTLTTLDDQRIAYLFPNASHASRIMVVGLGSGGFPVVQHLAMSGWRNFTLVDPDTLDSVNLVKHPGRASETGILKVEIARDWLLDRNPQSNVRVCPVDILRLERESTASLLAGTDLIISATDSNAVRHYVNDLALEFAKPMTLGMVHRGGIGGTVLAVRPGQTGCYACLEAVAERLDGIPSDDELEQTSDESDMIYGRGVTGYAAAGLSADIAVIAAIQAQLSVGELLRMEGAENSLIRSADANWVSIRLRSQGAWNWGTTLFNLPQIDNCVSCG